MQDITFTGKLRSYITNTNFLVRITFRTDLISKDHKNENFTVLETRIDDSAEKDHHEEFFGSQFQRLPYNLQAMEAFAEDHDLNLTISDSNGENSVLLVDSEASSSNSL